MKIIYVYICFKICMYKRLTGPYIGTDGQKYSTLIKCNSAESLRTNLRKGIFNPYPTAFPYGNGMVLHFYQQQESSTTKTVHKVINRGLKLMYSRLTLVTISINL